MCEPSWATSDAKQQVGSTSKLQYRDVKKEKRINKEGIKWKGKHNERQWKKLWVIEYGIKSERVLVTLVSFIANLT